MLAMASGTYAPELAPRVYEELSRLYLLIFLHRNSSRVPTPGPTHCHYHGVLYHSVIELVRAVRHGCVVSSQLAGYARSVPANALHPSGSCAACNFSTLNTCCGVPHLGWLTCAEPSQKFINFLLNKIIVS